LLTAEQTGELLRQAALARFQRKALELELRARQAGWEQALWEGLFRALGYKQNIWPMQRLAELRPIWQTPPGDFAACQARLFGIAGLLPAEMTREKNPTDAYLGRIWNQWWRERAQFSDIILPRETWKFNSLRPANHPQRRLALAAHWLASKDFVAKLERWFTAEISDAALADSLLETLLPGADEFWSWHWTFRSRRLSRPQPMLGIARVTDLAVNAILPWFWMRATEGGNEKLRRVAEKRHRAWPSSEDNSTLRLARARLLGGKSARALRGAAAQQGLLQIIRDFCEHSNALCEHCEFPELVKSFASR
jgi:hypothetical protein